MLAVFGRTAIRQQNDLKDQLAEDEEERDHRQGGKVTACGSEGE